MNFAHTQDQLDLRDGARDFLRASCTPEYLRLAVESGSAKETGRHFWDQLAEQGLLGFLVPEPFDGLGMDAIGFTLLAEEAGYVAMPDSFANSAGVTAAILGALSLADECARLATGETQIQTIHPSNPFLNHADDAQQLLVVNDDEIRLVDIHEASLTEIDSIDPMRKLYQCEFAEGAGKLLSSGEQAKALCELAENSGALYAAAELLGLSAAMIDMATAYAKDRQQFGKPIGSYQAVKHHLSSALVALEFAKPVVYKASADLVSCDPNIKSSVAHAKIAASDAAINAAEVAIQVYGGMGYTFEVDLHLWMKRSWALAGAWGDRNYQMNVIDKTLFEQALPIGPAHTFA